jgi:hypothetical protein
VPARALRWGTEKRLELRPFWDGVVNPEDLAGRFSARLMCHARTVTWEERVRKRGVGPTPASPAGQGVPRWPDNQVA